MSAADPDEVGPAIDDARYDELLRDFGPDAARELVASFLQITPAHVQALADATDPSQLAASAHRLRGGCVTVGLMRLSRAAAAVETAAQDGRAEDARALVGEVVARWRAAEQALRERIA